MKKFIVLALTMIMLFMFCSVAFAIPGKGHAYGWRNNHQFGAAPFDPPRVYCQLR